MEKMGLAFAWFTWHRLMHGACTCSYRNHEWYAVPYEHSKLWMLDSLPHLLRNATQEQVLLDCKAGIDPRTR